MVLVIVIKLIIDVNWSFHILGHLHKDNLQTQNRSVRRIKKKFQNKRGLLQSWKSHHEKLKKAKVGCVFKEKWKDALYCWMSNQHHGLNATISNTLYLNIWTQQGIYYFPSNTSEGKFSRSYSFFLFLFISEFRTIICVMHKIQYKT